MRPTGMTLCLLAALASACRAWDEHEFDVFDTVEEVGRNFYEWLEIAPDASASEVKELPPWWPPFTYPHMSVGA